MQFAVCRGVASRQKSSVLKHRSTAQTLSLRSPEGAVAIRFPVIIVCGFAANISNLNLPRQIQIYRNFAAGEIISNFRVSGNISTLAPACRRSRYPQLLRVEAVYFNARSTRRAAGPDIRSIRGADRLFKCPLRKRALPSGTPHSSSAHGDAEATFPHGEGSG